MFANAASAFLTYPCVLMSSHSSIRPAAVALAAGYSHTCALLTGGSVYCWGDNDFGQLGVGSRTRALLPQEVTVLNAGWCALWMPATRPKDEWSLTCQSCRRAASRDIPLCSPVHLHLFPCDLQSLSADVIDIYRSDGPLSWRLPTFMCPDDVWRHLLLGQ